MVHFHKKIQLHKVARVGLGSASNGGSGIAYVQQIQIAGKQWKLIREEIESVEFLVENRNGKKSMYIEGVFLQGNIKNRNGRMYPMETLRKEVDRYAQEPCSNRTCSW